MSTRSTRSGGKPSRNIAFNSMTAKNVKCQRGLVGRGKYFKPTTTARLPRTKITPLGDVPVAANTKKILKQNFSEQRFIIADVPANANIFNQAIIKANIAKAIAIEEIRSRSPSRREGMVVEDID